MNSKLVSLKQDIFKRIGNAATEADKIRAAIKADTTRTPEWMTAETQTRVGAITEALRKDIQTLQRSGLEIVAGARESAAKALQAATASSDTDKIVAAATLAPVLSIAASRPEALLAAYKRNFNDLAARTIIEKTIETTLDVVDPGQAIRLSEGYAALQTELAPLRSPAEVEAMQAIQQAEQEAEYLGNLATVAAVDLGAIGGNESLPDGLVTVSRTNAQFALERMEAAA